jgi:MFS transporter, FHS family, L-fucose permease
MNKNKYFLPITLIGILFFTFGYITWTNSTLIPFLKIACSLQNDTQAFLVASAFYLAFFFMAIPSALILNKTGYKNGIVLGLIVVIIGSGMFIPAAQSRSFILFLIGLFIQGTGIALLQTAANPYISILGPIESAAQRISIMGLFNKGAGMLAPIILSSIALKNISQVEKELKNALDITQKNEILSNLATRLIDPYIYLIVFLLLIAFLIYFSSLPEIDPDNEEVTENISNQTNNRSVFSYPNLVLGALAIVFCVTAEVIAGDGIGQYGKSIGISLDRSKYFPTYTLACMLVSYVLGILFIPKFVSQQDALKYSTILGMLLTVGILLTDGYVSVALIAFAGLANALLWPAIFPLGIAGLGKHTKIGAAILIMGIGPGGGIFPLAYTKLAEYTTPQMGFIVMGLCYAYLYFFATKGYKIKSWK